jgi:phosphoribosyl 1,2-cyclic phosphodiesterase
MAIELCVLASGSMGNCTVVRTPTGVMFIDAGIGRRITAQRLSGTGVRVADVSAICLTHLDRDHFSLSWIETIIQKQIRVYCHASRVADILASVSDSGFDQSKVECFQAQITAFTDEPFEPLPGVACRPVDLAHDQKGSHGFVADGFGRRLGYATDLGHIPQTFWDQFCGLDILCIESNYDPDMQLASRRPEFLKHRIMGGKGHLSNEQAFTAVRKILDRCEKQGLQLPRHIVLLHRSRECNCPLLLRSLFARDSRIVPRLTLTEQFSRTEWIRVSDAKPLVGEQLQLAWS